MLCRYLNTDAMIVEKSSKYFLNHSEILKKLNVRNVLLKILVSYFLLSILLLILHYQKISNAAVVKIKVMQTVVLALAVCVI